MSSSHSISRKYPGNLGEDDLKQALNLLFLIKGKQYQKKSPEFIIPTAEEFYYFSRFVSEEVFQKSSAKKLHRSLSSEKLEDRAHYLHFFEFLVQTKTSKVQDRLCLCLDIVFYALVIYFYTGIFMKFAMSDTINTQMNTDNAILAYKQFFINPIQWYCTHTMPCLEKNKKDIVQVCYTLYQASIVPLIKNTSDMPKNTTLYKTAQSFTNIFDDAFVESTMIDNLLKKPLILLLGL